MSWNYRVVKHSYKYKGKAYKWFAIHEVYYDKKGKPDMMSSDPDGPSGDTLKDLQIILKMMMKDAKRSPVFTPPKKWKINHFPRVTMPINMTSKAAIEYYREHGGK